MIHPEIGAALKEWAAMEQALANGSTTLLLRKGGLVEGREGFQAEHREFWLFPTGYHQNRGELVADAHHLLSAAREREPERGLVRLKHVAVAVEALWTEELAALERLEGLHPLTQSTVRSRFQYRRPGLHCLVLRVFRVPHPFLLVDTPDYQGCVSWVRLEQALPTAGAEPVLSEAAFDERRREILARLGDAARPVEVPTG